MTYSDPANEAVRQTATEGKAEKPALQPACNGYTGHPDLQDQVGAVLFFLQRLDMEMVDMLLDDHRTYQDMPKADFIAHLCDIRDVFLSSGDDFLERTPGYCRSKTCGNNCRGYRFIGRHSRRYFDLIVERSNGQLQDLYDCSDFRTQAACGKLAGRVQLWLPGDPDMPF